MCCSCRQFVVVAAAGDDDVPRLRASTFTQVVVTQLGGTAQFDCQYEHAASTDWYRDQRRLIDDDKSVHHRAWIGGRLKLFGVRTSDPSRSECPIKAVPRLRRSFLGGTSKKLLQLMLLITQLHVLSLHICV